MVCQMSKRIQRKRIKGWKMPLNTVYVGRPSKWGNPFLEEADIIYVMASHCRKFMSPWVVYQWGRTITAVQLFRDLMMDLNSHPTNKAIRARFELMRDTILDLRGKDLACWCALDQPCHTDVLLE